MGLAIGLGLAGTLSGCGIRATSVPVDAGPAPSRVSCALPDSGSSTDAFGTMNVQIYLVCSERLSPVQRTVRERRLDPLETARLLLGELEQEPDQAEQKGGFSSEMPGGLTVITGAPGDPPRTLRLTQDPAFLPSYAVGQLVCTLAGTQAAAPDRSVLIGGPNPRVPARRYTCDNNLRTNPDAGPAAGTPVS